MKFDQTITEQASLREIGRRIARYRLNRNLTQEALAREAGVSTPTIARLELGFSIQSSNIIRVLRALGLAGNLETLIPEPSISPIQQLKLHGKVRRRASGLTKPRSSKNPKTSWTWGDDKS